MGICCHPQFAVGMTSAVAGAVVGVSGVRAAGRSVLADRPGALVLTAGPSQFSRDSLIPAHLWQPFNRVALERVCHPNSMVLSVFSRHAAPSAAE